MKGKYSNRTLKKLENAASIVICTGAGMSAESGIATFRDADGLWSRFRPEDLASEPGFRRDPELVQSWYQSRQRQLRSTQPNAGHVAIAELEARTERFLLVTQNVDDLHEKAGSRNIIHLHGTLAEDRCIDCSTRPTTSLADCAVLPHRCTKCDGYIRPGVVWFGEMLPEAAMENAAAALDQCDVLLSVGTSGLVYPAAALPGLARARGAYTVEVNIEPTALGDEMDDRILGSAATVLPELLSTSILHN